MSLASGHEKRQITPATAMPDASPIILRDLPGIAEIERLVRGQGEWLTEAEIVERAERVSLSLFGMTVHDTYGPTSNVAATREQWATREKRPRDWEDSFGFLDREYYPDAEIVAVWEDIGADVKGADGNILRCAYLFDRQLLCIVEHLIPEAQLTIDGSGGATQAAEDWGSRLEEEAFRFKSQARKP